MANDGVAPAGNGNVDAKLDEILNLVMACSRGEVGNDAVESALSSIVSEHAPSSTSTSSSSATVEPPIIPTSTSAPCMETLKSSPIYGNRPIIPDDKNYDDDDDESRDNKKQQAAHHPNKPTPHLDNATAAKLKKAAKKIATERQKVLEQIPLGKMGERMLITFGDGPVPNYEVITAALLGTRLTLQRAILDARALRR